MPYAGAVTERGERAVRRYAAGSIHGDSDARSPVSEAFRTSVHFT